MKNAEYHIDAIRNALGDIEQAIDYFDGDDSCDIDKARREIDNATDELETLMSGTIATADPVWIVECFTYGLMTMEARYGASSPESQAIRAVIADLS